MTNLIQDLRDLAEWADGQPWEVPLNLPDALREAADKLEKMRWIPVEERLPEGYGKYLVVVKSGYKPFTTVMKYDTHEKQWINPWSFEITHWMPLPEEPKEVPNDKDENA